MSKQNRLVSLNLLKRQTETKAAATPAATGAKSKNPDYISTTVYLRRTTLADAKRAVLLDETKQHADVSELIEALLAEWLDSQKPRD